MRRAVPRALALAFFATQCLVAAYWVLSYQYADDDTGEAVRLARACVQLGECSARGTHASALGLSHGALWIRLIAHFLESGGGLRAVQITLLALLILSGAVSFLLIRRYVSERAALLTLLLYLQPITATTRFIELSNTTLLPLALALYYAGAAVCVESGSIVAAVLASVCLAAATSAHISCVLMVPFHLGLVTLFARRPPVTVAAAGLAFAIPFALESYEAAHAIAGLIVSTLPAVGLLVVTAALLSIRRLRHQLVGRVAQLNLRTQQLRERLAALPVRLRMRAAMKSALVYFSVAVWIGSAVVKLGIPNSHYLVPLVFPLLFLAADSTERLAWRPMIAVLLIGLFALLLFPFAPIAFELANAFVLIFSAFGVLAPVAWALQRRGVFFGHDVYSAAPPALAFVLAILTLVASLPDTLIIPRQRQAWPVSAAEKVAQDLYKSGLTFPQLMASMQRQFPGAIEHVVAMLDPQFFDEQRSVGDDRSSLLALMVEPAAVARTEGVALTFPISAWRSALVVRAPSYLDRTRVRTCYTATCGEAPPQDRCTQRQPDRPLRHVQPFFRVDGDSSWTPFGSAMGQQYCAVFLIPLHTSGVHVPHIVRAVEPWPLQVRIRRVAGVDFEGELPSMEVRLLDDREATGVMEVEVSSDGFAHSYWLEDPPLLEVTAANEHLLEPFRHRRTSLR
jgi:hypothetical protein